MPEQTPPERPCIFTIGHSNHDEQTFVDLLQQHRIDVVADVRSQPYSKYTTQFKNHDIHAGTQTRRQTDRQTRTDIREQSTS